jgi:hypothetical protein
MQTATEAPKPLEGIARMAYSTRTEVSMLRTVFGIGLMALVGLFLLKVFFGLFGVLFALLFILLGWAVKIAIVGGVIYLILRVFMPGTAKQFEDRFNK